MMSRKEDFDSEDPKFDSLKNYIKENKKGKEPLNIEIQAERWQEIPPAHPLYSISEQEFEQFCISNNYYGKVWYFEDTIRYTIVIFPFKNK